MIAVADASPLCYLILIGEIEVLPKLFVHVAVPQAVITELLHEDAPEAVRTWASNLPAWIDVEANPSFGYAWPGETSRWRASGDSWESMKADIILLDEKAARRVAASRGLRVTGVLGVLGEAATQGLVDLAPAIDKLRTTTFRASPALLKATLDRFGNR